LAAAIVPVLITVPEFTANMPLVYNKPLSLFNSPLSFTSISSTALIFPPWLMRLFPPKLNVFLLWIVPFELSISPFSDVMLPFWPIDVDAPCKSILPPACIIRPSAARLLPVAVNWFCAIIFRFPALPTLPSVLIPAPSVPVEIISFAVRFKSLAAAIVPALATAPAFTAKVPPVYNKPLLFSRLLLRFTSIF